jgi:teichuronic acid exporter
MSEESLKDKTVKGVVWSAVERFSVQGVQFVIGIILARLLMPSDYGIIAMLSIFLAVSQTFVDSGFSNALVRKIDRTESDYSTAFYFNIAIGIFFYLLLFLGAPYIALFYHAPILIPITRVVGLTIVFNSLCIVQEAILTIKIDFKTQAKVSLSSTILTGVIGVILAYKGFGVWALAIQSVSASFIRMFLFWILAKWRPVVPFSKQSFRQLFGYGSKLLASGLLDTTYNNIYPIVIGKFFTSSSLGFFTRAQQLAGFPSANITGILQRVTFPVLSTIQNEDERLRQNYRKILRLSAYVIFPVMVGLAAVASPLIHVLLTSKWEGCILYLQIICFAMMWYPVHAINLNLLQVKGRSDLFLRLEIIKKCVGVSILCLTIPLGITAMCIGMCCSSLIALVINTYYTGKLIQVGFFRQMRDLLPIAFNCLIMGVGAYMVTCLPIPNICKLMGGILVGLVYYMCASRVLKSEEFYYLANLISRRKPCHMW